MKMENVPDEDFFLVLAIKSYFGRIMAILSLLIALFGAVIIELGVAYLGLAIALTGAIFAILFGLAADALDGSKRAQRVLSIIPGRKGWHDPRHPSNAEVVPDGGEAISR